MSYGNGTNTPNGLVPRQDITGSPWNGQTSQYNIISGYANNLFTGDPVTLLNTGGIGIAVGGAAAAQGPTVGVFMGCKYLLNNQYVFSPYWPTGTVPDNATNAVAFVVDDPNVLFDIQVSSTANPLANPCTIVTANLGLNANFQVGNPNGGTGNPAGGSTRTGVSAFYLNFESLTPGTSATLNLKVMAFTPVPGNVSGVNFNNALCLINNHILKGGTGTAGI
jgi:hypothetical protein